MKLIKIAIAFTVAVSLIASPALIQEASAGLPKVSLKKVDDINLGLPKTAKGIKQYNKEVNKLVANAKKRKTNLERIYYVHNALIERYPIARNDLPSIGYCGTAYRTITTMDGGGDPLGFAHLNYHILKKLGIKSEVVLNKDKTYAWNKVKLDGKYYNVDVYNDGEYNHVDFQSFMVSDKIFKQYDDKKVAVSKNVSKDTKYDFFNRASNAIKFTDKEVYYVHDIFEESVTQIRSFTLKGKDKLVYQPDDNWGRILRWKGYVYYNEIYMTKVGNKEIPRLKVYRVTYKGKNLVEMLDSDCIITTVGENGIVLRHHETEKKEYINLN